MRRVFDRIRRIARADLPVLVTGETGTGKELVARAIHDTSGRPGPFVALNCGALTSTLAETELFGHVKGSFTGAASDRAGVFEAATGGTLFLDEIGELPLELQPRLLRVLETMSVRRIGDAMERRVDVRVVAATHRNLAQMVREGAFREDLYHRLRILSLDLPPLRARPEDVLLLACSFLAGSGFVLGTDAQSALLSHSWGGNVRELRNCLLRARLFAGEVIGAADLELEVTNDGPVDLRPDPAPAGVPIERRNLTLVEEKSFLMETLAACGNNRSRAARRLGLSRSAFHERLRKLGVPNRFSPERVEVAS